MRRKFTPLTYQLLFWLILASAVAVIASSLGGGGFFAHPVDELYYIHFASFISSRGIESYPLLVKEYIEEKIHWQVPVPQPLRAGFIVPAAFLYSIFQDGFLSLAYLSFISYVFFLILCFFYTRKFFGDRIAALSAFLLAFSPLAMSMARRALTESTFQLALALSVWLFLDFIKERKRTTAVLFVLAYVWALLIKETAVLLSVFFCVFLIVRKVLFQHKASGAEFLFATAFPFGIAAGVYLIVAGPARVLDIIRLISLGVSAKQQYTLLFCSGPWFRYIIDYTLLSPWVVILSVGFILYYCATVQKPDEATAYLMLCMVLLFVLFNLFPKVVRYAMILDMPMRIFSALMLKELVVRRFPRHGWGAVTVLAVCIAFGDYLSFRHLFLQEAIYDPVSLWLLKARSIIH